MDRGGNDSVSLNLLQKTQSERFAHTFFEKKRTGFLLKKNTKKFLTKESTLYLPNMSRKKMIARILLVVAFLFTTVFQLIHSYQHISTAVAYENEHRTHAHYTEKRVDYGGVQLTEDHSHSDHCFVCDSIPTSGLAPVQIEWQSMAFQTIQQVQEDVTLLFTPLSHVYFSLRAPPAVV